VTVTLDQKKCELARLVIERDRVIADFADVKKAHQDTIKEIEKKIVKLAVDVNAGQPDLPLSDGEVEEGDPQPWLRRPGRISVSA
jgi:hypothetical protein